MNEAIKNLEASQQAHAVELKRLQENNHLQSKIKKLTNIEKQSKIYGRKQDSVNIEVFILTNFRNFNRI